VQLDPGEVVIGYDFQNQPIIRNAEGKVSSVAERASAKTRAEEQAKSEFDLVDITMPDGSKQKVTRDEYIRRTGGEPGQAQGAPGLTTELSPAQQAVQGEFQKTLDSARTGFETARRRAGTIQQLRNAINSPDFDTGYFVNQKAALTNMLSSLGVTGDRANAFLRNATSFRQGVNDLTMGSLAELVGAISNFEIDFSQKRFGTITDPTEANQFALDILEAKDRIATDYYNFLLKNPSADAIEKWKQSEQGSKNLFEDPKLRKWLEKREVQSGPNKGKTAYLLPDSANGSWVVFD
jgi:hypothetical protein